MSILDEYVKSTGVDYIETKINDSSSMKNIDEQVYVDNLYDKAMIPDKVFSNFIETKMDCSHIKEVIKRSEEKDNINKKDINKKKKLIELFKSLIEDE